MIDTIKGYINIRDKEYSDFEHLLINASRNQRSDKDHYTMSFNLSNFKITIQFDSNNKPTILRFNGSLPKFYFGNNLAQLDLETTKKAVEMFSDNLNLDISEATITRVDVGFSFILKKPIYKYISCLQEFPRLPSLRYPGSVTFGTSQSNSLTYYDKQKEIKKNQKDFFHELNTKFPNEHIIRYEIRLCRLLNQKLDTKSIKTKSLYSISIQKKLFTIWRNQYYKTRKSSVDVDPIYLIKKRNGLYLYLSFHGMKILSYDKIRSEIYSLKFNVKNLSAKRSKMMFPIKKLLKEVNSKKLEGNIMNELDRKIELMGEIFN